MTFPSKYGICAGALLAALALLLAPALPGLAQAPAPASPAFFGYDNHTPFPSTKELTATIDGIREYTVTYPSPVTTPYPLNNTVTGYYFVPSAPGPHPAMIVMHEWLPTSLAVEDRMCESMAENGVAALLLVQPWSLNRRPQNLHPDPDDPEWSDPDIELLSSDVPHTVDALRQAVLDARRGFDWLSEQPQIDPNRLGVSGISIGAIIAALTAGVDRRAKVLLSIDGGGDVAYIIWSSLLTQGLKLQIRANGWSYDALKQAMEPVEPTNYLQGFDPKNALLINGRYDTVVRPWQAEHLARALGGAQIIWTDTGHYGVGLSETQIKQVGAQFLKARFFENQPYQAPPGMASHTIKLGFLLGGHEVISPMLAYQLIDFDRAGRYSFDGQLTLHGIAGALSARLNNSTSLGIEFPLFHGTIRPLPFYSVNMTL